MGEQLIKELIEYFEEHHAGKILYPEYIEFHLHKALGIEAGIIVPMFETSFTDSPSTTSEDDTAAYHGQERAV